MFPILMNLLMLPWHDTLLSTAKRLAEEGNSEVAIATAMMACETAFERAFAQLFEYRKVGFMEESIEQLFPSYSLANDRVRAVYVALSGDKIHVKPFWPRFKELTKLRHQVVHKGTRATPDQAQDAVVTAREVVNHVSGVLRAAQEQVKSAEARSNAT